MEDPWPPLRRGVKARLCTGPRECLEECRSGGRPPVILPLDAGILREIAPSLPGDCVVILKPGGGRAPLEGGRR